MEHRIWKLQYQQCGGGSIYLIFSRFYDYIFRLQMQDKECASYFVGNQSMI